MEIFALRHCHHKCPFCPKWSLVFALNCRDVGMLDISFLASQKQNFFSFSLFSTCAIWVVINPICPCCMCVILFIFLSFDSFLFFSFWPCPVAYGIFVPWPGIEPAPLAVKAQNPNHWTVREFPLVHSLHMTACLWVSSLSWIHFYHPSYSFITPITEPSLSWA